ERLERTLRLEAPAHVLDRDRVAARRGAQDEGDEDEALLVVRGALEERGVTLAVRGAVDVGVEDRPVAHRHRDVAIDGHAQSGRHPRLPSLIVEYHNAAHRSTGPRQAEEAGASLARLRRGGAELAATGGCAPRPCSTTLPQRS